MVRRIVFFWLAFEIFFSAVVRRRRCRRLSSLNLNLLPFSSSPQKLSPSLFSIPPRRLKVHYRAPPDIRGSGKERGHGTELQYCPRCGKELKAGKHHVGCFAGRSAPRQAAKRFRLVRECVFLVQFAAASSVGTLSSIALCGMRKQMPREGGALRLPFSFFVFSFFSFSHWPIEAVAFARHVGVASVRNGHLAPRWLHLRCFSAQSAWARGLMAHVSASLPDWRRCRAVQEPLRLRNGSRLREAFFNALFFFFDLLLE